LTYKSIPSHIQIPQCKQRIPPKKILQKNFSKKKFSQNIPPKNFLQKIFQNNSKKKFPQKFSKNFKHSPKNSKQLLKKDFENIQFPISHLEAKNPFGLVFISP
jgi:uncharacterized protein YeaO (DUF488 family)